MPEADRALIVNLTGTSRLPLRKPARLKHVCLTLNRMPKMRREDETRVWRFPGKTGSDVCLGRVGGRPPNLVERPQINKTTGTRPGKS